MEKSIMEELIISSASKVHEDWCCQELKGFYERGHSAKTEEVSVIDALRMACYKGENLRNVLDLDISYFVNHDEKTSQCLLDFNVFMDFVNAGAIKIKRFAKRTLTEEEIERAGNDYRNGEENILRPFERLSSDSKKENIDAAIGAVNVYEQLSKAGITIEQMELDPEIKNLIGIAIHTDWLKRNMDHPNDSLKVSYSQLDEWTQQQDLTVFSAMLNVIKQNTRRYFVQQVEGFYLPDYVDEERRLLGINVKVKS